MEIAWGDLGLVLAVGLLVGVGAVAHFAVGVRTLASPAQARHLTASRATAGLCFAVCAAAVGYGIYTLVPHFH